LFTSEKICYKLLRVLTIIINKANMCVRVSKYKRFNNNEYLCNNCFLQCRFEFVNSCQYMMCLLALGTAST